MEARAVILLVTGGRYYANRAAVFAALDRVHAKRPITLLVHGGAEGADTLAEEWAVAHGVRFRRFAVTKHEWIHYGKGAGPMRNARMLEEAKPAGVVAFPGGAGTADMVRRALAARITVWEPMAKCTETPASS